MSFEKIETAARVRDVIKRQAKNTIKEEVPKKIIGRMMSLDLPRLRGTVWFPGDEQPIEVSIFPTAVPAEWQHRQPDFEGEASSTDGWGSLVAVERLNNVLYVTHILTGGESALDFRTLGLSLIMQEAAPTVAGDPGSNAAVDIVGNPHETFINLHVSDDTLLNGEAIEFGPFTTYDADYPRFGSMEFTVQVGGSVKIYKMASNPKVEFASPYQTDRKDAWYRLIAIHSINDDDGGSYIDTNDTNNYDFDLDLAFKKTRYGNATDFSVWKELWIRIIKRGTWSGGLDAKVSLRSTNIYKGRSLGGRELFMKEKKVNPRSARGYLGYHKAQNIFSNELSFIEDVFDYTAVNGWISAQGDGIFVTPSSNPSTFSADGLKGTVAIAANNSTSEVELGGLSIDNIDIFATVSIQAVATGANARIGFLTRWDSGGTGDNCTFNVEFKTDSTIGLLVTKTLSGVTTTVSTVATGISYAANQKFRVYVRMFTDPLPVAEEHRAQMTVWEDPDFQPATPAVNAVVTGISFSGNLGVRVIALTGNTNTKPLSIDLHDIKYITPEWGVGENVGHLWRTGPYRSGILRIAADLQKTWTHDGSFLWDGSNLRLTGKIYLHGIGGHRDGLVSTRAYALFPSNFQYILHLPSTISSGDSIDWHNGVPLDPEESLWLAIPPGADNRDLTANFFIVSPLESIEYHLPEWALLIASRGPSGTYPEIRLGNGTFLDGWKNISFNTNWSNFGGGYSTAQYRKEPANIVRLKGLIKHTTTNATGVVATLPVGFRPSTTRFCLCGSSAGPTLSTSQVDIKTNGDIQVMAHGTAGGTAFVGLDGITFPTD